MGFVLLGLRNYLAGVSLSNVILHGIVAAGFVLLAFLDHRRRKSRREM
ncbi:MAG: hypothetical protein GY953_57450 [bacterium]|nr:hypothetical protein [bacterium]